jgi:hypothetical protein
MRGFILYALLVLASMGASVYLVVGGITVTKDFFSTLWRG